MYTISAYSCNDKHTVISQTENVSNVVDKIIRITAKITEHYASDIYYIIQSLYKAIDKKEDFNRILFFREDGVTSQNIPIISYDLDYLQTWQLIYDSETNITVFKRVHIRWNA